MRVGGRFGDVVAPLPAGDSMTPSGAFAFSRTRWHKEQQSLLAVRLSI